MNKENKTIVNVNFLHQPFSIPPSITGKKDLNEFVKEFLIFQSQKHPGAMPEKVIFFVAKSTDSEKPITNEELKSISKITEPLYGISAICTYKGKDETNNELYHYRAQNNN